MRKWSKLLMQPFYPGMGNRDKVKCTGLPGLPPNVVSAEESDAIDTEKRAWDAYFAGTGPRPHATQPNT